MSYSVVVDWASSSLSSELYTSSWFQTSTDTSVTEDTNDTGTHGMCEYKTLMTLIHTACLSTHFHLILTTSIVLYQTAVRLISKQC